MRLESNEVADLLARLYREEFGGKANGRFKIARNDLAEISGRSYIKQTVIDQISDVLADKYDLLMIDLGDEFPIIKISIVRKYRGVPSRLVKEYAPTHADEEENED